MFWLGVTAVAHLAALVLMHRVDPRSPHARGVPQVDHLSVEAPTTSNEELPAWLRDLQRDPLPRVPFSPCTPAPFVTWVPAARTSPWRPSRGDPAALGLDHLGTAKIWRAHRRGYEDRPSQPFERATHVLAGRLEVRGSLSKEVIRRTIQRHLSEVRFCYEQQLNRRPGLRGAISVQFVVSPTGAVQMAAVSASDIGSPPVETCIAGAVLRWSFRAPEDGRRVVVSAPFVFDGTVREPD